MLAPMEKEAEGQQTSSDRNHRGADDECPVEMQTIVGCAVVSKVVHLCHCSSSAKTTD